MQIVILVFNQSLIKTHTKRTDIVVEYDAFYTNNFTIYRNIDQNERKKISNTFLFFVLYIVVEIHFVVIFAKTVNFETKKVKINLIIP
jgi:hypothetical protein